jgi:hypothetical protein
MNLGLPVEVWLLALDGSVGLALQPDQFTPAEGVPGGSQTWSGGGDEEKILCTRLWTNLESVAVYPIPTHYT